MPYKDPQKQKEWEHINRERRLKQKKERYQKYKEKEKLRIKEWYQKNKETQRQKHREYSKEYRQTPEGKQKLKEYYQNNPEIDLRAQIKYLKKLSYYFDITYNKYRLALISWSKTIRKRDIKQCIICGSTHKLNAHHIFYKKDYPELSLNLNNGVTLCHLHHREVHQLN